MSDVVSGVTDALVVATFVGAVLFVVRYAVTRWRRTAEGQNVMAFMFVVALLTGLATVAVLLGTGWVGRDWVRLGAWSLLFSVVWWRVLLLFRRQHEGEREKAKRWNSN